MFDIKIVVFVVNSMILVHQSVILMKYVTNNKEFCILINRNYNNYVFVKIQLSITAISRSYYKKIY